MPDRYIALQSRENIFKIAEILMNEGYQVKIKQECSEVWVIEWANEEFGEEFAYITGDNYIGSYSEDNTKEDI